MKFLGENPFATAKTMTSATTQASSACSTAEAPE